MTYFVSYELMQNGTAVDFGCVVIHNSSPSEVQNDLDAIKNDSGKPDCSLRVICLTVLPTPQ